MGSGCIAPNFLDLGTSWRWVFSFMPQSLYPRERTPSTHCIGGSVGPRAGLNDMEKRKFLTLPGLELRPLDRPVRSQSLYRLRHPGSHSLDKGIIKCQKHLYRLSLARSRSQWQRSLRDELSSLARTLGSWVRIPLEAWMSVLWTFILCVGSGLATDWSPVQEVLETVYRTKKLKKRRRPNKGLYSHNNNNSNNHWQEGHEE
jgi:hypothetical protein